MGKMTPAGEISGAPAIGGIGTCLVSCETAPIVWRRAAATRQGNELSVTHSPHRARAPLPATPIALRHPPISLHLKGTTTPNWVSWTM